MLYHILQDVAIHRLPLFFVSCSSNWLSNFISPVPKYHSIYLFHCWFSSFLCYLLPLSSWISLYLLYERKISAVFLSLFSLTFAPLIIYFLIYDISGACWVLLYYWHSLYLKLCNNLYIYIILYTNNIALWIQYILKK